VDTIVERRVQAKLDPIRPHFVGAEVGSRVGGKAGV
jgi:hypothetical protein